LKGEILIGRKKEPLKEEKEDFLLPQFSRKNQTTISSKRFNHAPQMRKHAR